MLACFVRSNKDEKSKISNRFVLTLCKFFENFLMWFNSSRREELQYDISLKPVRSLFVVPDFRWKTKKVKHTPFRKSFPCFQIGGQNNNNFSIDFTVNLINQNEKKTPDAEHSSSH